MDSYINICFVGCVSTGKSMLLNSFFCENLTQCKIKRTTMVPNVYVENPPNSPNIQSSDEINNLISSVNQEIIKKTENGNQLSIDECQ